MITKEFQLGLFLGHLMLTDIAKHRFSAIACGAVVSNMRPKDNTCSVTINQTWTGYGRPVRLKPLMQQRSLMVPLALHMLLQLF